MAAACLLAGWMTTDGCILGALGAGGSGVRGGSGWFRTASGEAGLSSRWWAVLPPLPLPRQPPRPLLGGGGGDREGVLLVCRVTCLVAGALRAVKGHSSSRGAGWLPSQVVQCSRSMIDLATGANVKKIKPDYC